MTNVVISTRNAHKVQEIRQILGEGFCCLTLDDFPGAPAVVEDAATFSGNASKKVLTLARWLPESGAKLAASYILADDSGLEVDALDGAPGVHSARFAAGDGPGNAPDAANNAKLLALLGNVPQSQRTARFRCVMALLPLAGASVDAGDVVLFEGICEGVIQQAPSGGAGFGYDPLFVPNGCTESFAELGESVKNKISHRARALAKLREYLERSRT